MIKFPFPDMKIYIHKYINIFIYLGLGYKIIIRSNSNLGKTKIYISSV